MSFVCPRAAADSHRVSQTITDETETCCDSIKQSYFQVSRESYVWKHDKQVKCSRWVGSGHTHTHTHNVNTMQCSSSMWVKYGWIPAHVEPSMIVFVDSGVVFPRRKHSGQRGYQWTRLTDAGVPLHVVSLIESAQAIWTDFEDIMKIPMIFIGRLGPLCVSVHLYFAFLVFNLHHYWFLYFFPAWCFLGTLPHTEWLINLKMFTAPSVIRGGLILTILEHSFIR